MDELVAIAKIVKPRGLRGEVAADLLTDFPDRFEGLTDVASVAANGDRSILRIENFWFQNGRVVLKIEGYDSVESAEALRNLEICVTESDAVELNEGEFFDWQLSGCEVETIGGQKIGTVRELLRTGGTEILVIDGEEKEFLVPFAKAICVEVDIEKKSIRIDPPEGVLDF